jgi:hypothetical protein
VEAVLEQSRLATGAGAPNLIVAAEFRLSRRRLHSVAQTDRRFLQRWIKFQVRKVKRNVFGKGRQVLFSFSIRP